MPTAKECQDRIDARKSQWKRFGIKVGIAGAVVYVYMTQLGLNLQQLEAQTYKEDRDLYRHQLAMPQPAATELKTPEPDKKVTLPDDCIININKQLGGVLKGKAGDIVRACQQYELDPYLVYAIIRHETGNGTSSAIKSLNNPGGIMNPSTGKLQSYRTLEAGINDMCLMLKTVYIDQGLVSIEEIARRYCPVGAKNDPGNLNKSWVPMVTKYYQEVR